MSVLSARLSATNWCTEKRSQAGNGSSGTTNIRKKNKARATAYFPCAHHGLTEQLIVEKCIGVKRGSSERDSRRGKSASVIA